MVTPPWPTSSSMVECSPSTFTRSSFVFYFLKIVGNVKETVKQFKEIETYCNTPNYTLVVYYMFRV